MAYDKGEAASAGTDEGEDVQQAESLAATLQRLSGELCEKKAAKALLKERNALQARVRQLEEKTNASAFIQRNKSLQVQLAEADRGDWDTLINIYLKLIIL